jgi:hypothetical protein
LAAAAAAAAAAESSERMVSRTGCADLHPSGITIGAETTDHESSSLCFWRVDGALASHTDQSTANAIMHVR